MNELITLRNNIDEIDDSILELLKKRMEIVDLVGQLKRQNNTVIYHPDREKEIIERLGGKDLGKLTKSAVEAIYLEIFGVSRNLELPELISFLAISSRHGSIFSPTWKSITPSKVKPLATYLFTSEREAR